MPCTCNGFYIAKGWDLTKLKTNYKPKILNELNEGFVAKDGKNYRNGTKDMGTETTKKMYII